MGSREAAVCAGGGGRDSAFRRARPSPHAASSDSTAPDPRNQQRSFSWPTSRCNARAGGPIRLGGGLPHRHLVHHNPPADPAHTQHHTQPPSVQPHPLRGHSLGAPGVLYARRPPAALRPRFRLSRHSCPFAPEPDAPGCPTFHDLTRRRPQPLPPRSSGGPPLPHATGRSPDSRGARSRRPLASATSSARSGVRR